MAFEVFDDVAFFWFFITVLGIVVVPWTIVRVLSFLCSYLPCCRAKDHKEEVGKTCFCHDCVQQRRNANKPKIFTLKNFIFVGLWVLFITISMQVPEMQDQKMATFDPYVELDLDKGADLAVIKRQFRQLSLKYHPDRNPDNADAEKKFIAINKAHQILTDEDARRNWEKYGNPDGYQGTSVTIGLPSFLTSSEHERQILVVYFLAFFIVLPVIVGVWWSRASNYHESGVLHDTTMIFWHTVNENMTTKFLVQYLAAAVEYKKLDSTSDPEKMRKLVIQIMNNEAIAKQKVPAPYAVNASTLLHAHMLRVPIPESLRGELLFVLQHAHRLLATMLDINRSRGFLKPTISTIKLSQLISQALWVHGDSLLQLPHFTEHEVQLCRRRRVLTLAHFRRLSASSRRLLLPDFSEQQLADLEAVCALFPELDVDVKCSVLDEEGIREGDLVQVMVDLTRVPFEEIANSIQLKLLKKDKAALKKQQQGKAEEEGDDEEESAAGIESFKSHATDSESAARVKKIQDTKKQGKEDSKEEEKKVERPADPNSLDAIITKTRKDPSPWDQEGRLAHTPVFPHPKRENWYAILVDSEGRLAGFSRVPPFEHNVQVPLMVGAGKPGRYDYKLHVMCDAYVGCDLEVDFHFNVDAPLPEDDDDVDKKVDDDDDLEDEEEEPGKWYFLYASSFGEFILTIFLLILLGIVVFDIMWSRGWWQKWIQPTLMRLQALWQTWAQPLVDRVSAVVAPYMPGQTFVGQALSSAYDSVGQFFSLWNATVPSTPVANMRTEL